MSFACSDFLRSVDRGLFCINRNFSDGGVILLITAHVSAEMRKWLKAERRRLAPDPFNVSVGVDIWHMQLSQCCGRAWSTGTSVVLLHRQESNKWAAHAILCVSVVQFHGKQALEAFPEGKERPDRYCQLIFASCCADNDRSVEKRQASSPAEAAGPEPLLLRLLHPVDSSPASLQSAIKTRSLWTSSVTWSSVSCSSNF